MSKKAKTSSGKRLQTERWTVKPVMPFPLTPTNRSQRNVSNHWTPQPHIKHQSPNRSPLFASRFPVWNVKRNILGQLRYVI
jgi:hypothetical protein